MFTADFSCVNYGRKHANARFLIDFIQTILYDGLRFYLKYIAPNQAKIDRGGSLNLMLANLSGLDSVMGLQFENLVIHNRRTLWKMMEIPTEEIEMDGPFFQN